MQKIIYILILIVGFGTYLSAQNHITCDGTRYISEVFTTYDTTLNVLYGNNTTVGGTNQDLYMDIFEPSSDAATNRPVVVLAFGGSFIGGAKEDMHDLCVYYAKRGFVAVSIDYRLYDGALFPLPSAAVMTDEVIKAVSDMKAAVRYLREDAATSNLYKIDSNYIFVGGVSAGGIVASHLAYVDAQDSLGASEQTALNNNGGFTGNSSTNTQYSSAVQGVLNYSGALRAAYYIDANDPPLFSVHDDADETVPYGGGDAKIFGFPIVYVEGSGMMNPRADVVGVANQLITIPNSTGHVSYFNNGAAVWQDSVQEASAKFVHDEVVCPMLTGLAEVQQQEVAAKFYPNPSASDIVVELAEVPSVYSVIVYDNLGRIVAQQQGLNESQYTIQRAALAAGVYLVGIQFESEKIAPIFSRILFK